MDRILIDKGNSATLPQIAINLPRTYEKLHYKGESYRFVRSFGTDRHTDGHLIICK